MILADESAGWTVAGLPQLERLVLVANDWAKAGVQVAVSIFWKPGCRSSAETDSVRSFLPITIATTGAEIAGNICLISTRLCPFPGEVDSVIRAFTVSVPSGLDWAGLFQVYSSRLDATPESSARWRSLGSTNDIPAAETELLRRMTKPQDGLVSRWINRPISRRVTRRLLQLPITPDAWTATILILPIVSFFLLLNGHYGAIVSACILFQLFSILDGCDGEIARAKYLQSAIGARIDHVCDQAGNILFIIGLGLGLYRTTEGGDRFFLESVICAIAFASWPVIA